MRTTPPTGVVTLVFTDLQGSSSLWEQHGSAFRERLDAHNQVVRKAAARWDGYEVKTIGDAFMLAFADVSGAVGCAVEIQHEMEPLELRVRIGLHTGEPLLEIDREGRADYFGPPVNRAARIAAAAHGGQILLSEASHQLAAAAVGAPYEWKDHGRHRLKGLERTEHLWELRHPDLPRRECLPPRTADTVRSNLPASLTTFVGREAELAELTALLRDADTRLLTLVGSGGCGKTRLALRLGEALLAEAESGVWLVELAPVADGARVEETVAVALGVYEDSNRPLLRSLIDHLKPQECLLLLDNCEHLLAATAAVAASLLAACPRLRVVATSQQPLGLGGERVYRVPSLKLPADDSPTCPADLRQYDAIRLFEQRAILSRSNFQLTAQNASAVAEVCVRLDGIPLAIELAAARTKVLRVEQIAARLDDRFRLLTGGSRSVLPRQQTLRAAVEWSYQLLDEPQRMLLQRLAIFAGGCTLEAAEAVCGGDPLDGCEIFDLLAELVDKSLAVFDEETGRYLLLETVRQFALEQLGDRLETLRERHADFFRARAEATALLPLGPDHQRHEVYQSDLDNYRAALRHYVGQPEGGVAWLSMFQHLATFLTRTGRGAEVEELAEVVLAAAAKAPPVVAAETLRALAWTAAHRADCKQAAARFRAALARLDRAAEPALTALTLRDLGVVLGTGGEFKEAIGELEQALAITRSAPDQALHGEVLNTLCRLTVSAEMPDRALELAEESTRLGTELSDERVLRGCLSSRAMIAWRGGDFATAERYFREAHRLSVRTGESGLALLDLMGLADMARVQERYHEATTRFEQVLREARDAQRVEPQIGALHNLAYVAWRQHQWSTARARLREAFSLFGDPPLVPPLTLCLVRGGLLRQSEGDAASALSLFAAGYALREVKCGPFLPPDDDLYRAGIAACRARLGDDADAIWATGRTVTPQTAVAFGLAHLAHD